MNGRDRERIQLALSILSGRKETLDATELCLLGLNHISDTVLDQRPIKIQAEGILFQAITGERMGVRP